jgi:hypothetical protein
MDSQTLINTYNYLRDRLKGEHKTIFISETPLYHQKEGGRHHYGILCFQLEEKLHAALCILIMNATNYLIGDKRRRVRHIFGGWFGSWKDKSTSPTQCPEVWNVGFHHYLVNKDSHGHKEYVVRCLVSAVTAFHSFISTLHAINNTR